MCAVQGAETDSGGREEGYFGRLVEKDGDLAERLGYEAGRVGEDTGRKTDWVVDLGEQRQWLLVVGCGTRRLVEGVWVGKGGGGVERWERMMEEVRRWCPRTGRRTRCCQSFCPAVREWGECRDVQGRRRDTSW